MWFLSLKTDNRIFQEKSVPEIVEDVISRGQYQVSTAACARPTNRGNMRPIGESDLDFVQRLMEHEGIFYFFEHDDTRPPDDLADSNAVLKPAPGSETLPYEPDSRISFREGDFITRWVPRHSGHARAFAHTDYDFTKPSSDLMSKSEWPLGHALDKAENYRYPGYHTEHGRGDALAEYQVGIVAGAARVEAKGTARALWSGRTFKLDLFPRETENIEYLVLRVDVRMWDEQVRSGQRRGSGFEVSLRLAPTRNPFRPARRTPHPVMRGPQTAVVVGPAGAEIFTDKYSRVKVQFHWDRQGKKDAHTTCFIRVSSAWAGSGWGFIQIPRIGQEVIVDFLEGDPDQPIITGRVYNAERCHPTACRIVPRNRDGNPIPRPAAAVGTSCGSRTRKVQKRSIFRPRRTTTSWSRTTSPATIGNDFSEDVGHDATAIHRP